MSQQAMCNLVWLPLRRAKNGLYIQGQRICKSICKGLELKLGDAFWVPSVKKFLFPILRDTCQVVGKAPRDLLLDWQGPLLASKPSWSPTADQLPTDRRLTADLNLGTAC